jgi:hypothetical protein
MEVGSAPSGRTSIAVMNDTRPLRAIPVTIRNAASAPFVSGATSGWFLRKGCMIESVALIMAASSLADTRAPSQSR